MIGKHRLLVMAVIVALNFVLASRWGYAVAPKGAESVLPTAATHGAGYPVSWRIEQFTGGGGRFVQGPRLEGAAEGFMAFDSAGNAYVACGTFIEMIGTDGCARLIAGTPGLAGSSDGPPSQATFAGANDIAIVSDNILYVADGINGTLRRLTRNADGLWHTETVAGRPLKRGHVDGRGADVLFGPVFDSIVTDRDGVVYIMDGDWLRKYDKGAVITLNAGTGRDDGPLARARFCRAMGGGHCLAFGDDGCLYVADRWNMAIRKVDFVKGEVSTFAGKPAGAETGKAPRDGTLLDARFHPGGGPCTLFFNPVWKFFVVISADERSSRIIRDGWVHSLSLPGVGPVRGGPCGVDGHGRVYFYGGHRLVPEMEKSSE